MSEVPLYREGTNREGEDVGEGVESVYKGTSLIRNRHPLGPYTRTMPRALRWS